MTGAVDSTVQILTTGNDDKLVRRGFDTSPDRARLVAERKQHQNCIVWDTHKRNARQVLLHHHKSELLQRDMDNPHLRAPLSRDDNIDLAQVSQGVLEVISLM
jgi:hypothetical protein